MIVRNLRQENAELLNRSKTIPLEKNVYEHCLLDINISSQASRTDRNKNRINVYGGDGTDAE